MKIQIISVGKLSSEITPLVGQYLKMSGWKLIQQELPHSNKKDVEQIKADEAELIRKKLRTNGYLILLDAQGKRFSSEQFTQILQELMMQGNDVYFVIGGAYGLHKSLFESANLILSLSDMTFPHQLVKLLLVEQLYRAQTIINNHPYHK
jgi:23S rRNA (pseudouridine1915-N3)-methyltransferase